MILKDTSIGYLPDFFTLNRKLCSLSDKNITFLIDRFPNFIGQNRKFLLNSHNVYDLL